MWSVGSADPKRTGWSGVGWRGPKSLHISAPPLLKPEEAKIFWDVLAQDVSITCSQEFYCVRPGSINILSLEISLFLVYSTTILIHFQR